MSDPVVYAVDDDESIQRALSLLLNSLGLEVETFSGAQAVNDHQEVRIPGQTGH